MMNGFIAVVKTIVDVDVIVEVIVVYAVQVNDQQVNGNSSASTDRRKMAEEPRDKTIPHELVILLSLRLFFIIDLLQYLLSILF
jgi:hypothetical protein